MVPKLRQEVEVKVDIVTSDDIKIYYTGKFQDFIARYIIKIFLSLFLITIVNLYQTIRGFNNTEKEAF